MSAKNFVFRVDSSNIIGTGHFWRCFRLAIKLKSFGGTISFIAASMLQQHKELVLKSGFNFIQIGDDYLSNASAKHDPCSPYSSWLPTSEIEDANLCQNVLCSQLPDTHFIIVDHYALGMVWEKHLGQLGPKVVIIDDLANRKHFGDLLIDQNWFGDTTYARYDNLVNSGCKLLLGPSYFMGEFDCSPKRYVSRNSKFRILVYAGGTTDHRKLLVFARLAANLYLWNKNLSFDFLFAQREVQSTQLFNLIRKSKGVIIKFSPSFSNLLKEYDFLLSAGGTTLWEREYYNIPAALISIADNQVPILESMSGNGTVIYLGHFNPIDIRKANAKIKNAIKYSRFMRYKSKRLNLVDGAGITRIINEILIA